MKVTQKLSLVLALVIVGVLIAMFWQGLQKDPRLLPSKRVNEPAPAFRLPVLEHPQWQVTDHDFKNQIVILNVWATWCKTCEAEHSMMMVLSQKYRNYVSFYGVNYKDDPRRAMAWLQQHGNPYRFSILDQNGQLAIDFGVYGAPETFLIDRQGKVLYRHTGEMTEQVWREQFFPRILQILQSGKK